MKRAAVVYKIKPAFGPIMHAIQNTGIPVLSFADEEEMRSYDQLIIFHNKLPPPLPPHPQKAWWMCDFRSPSDLAQEETNCDLIFICNQTYSKDFRNHFKKPVFYMPQCGMDDPIVEGRPVKWEVVFIGNIAPRYYHENRTLILDRIAGQRNLEHIQGEGQTVDQAWIYRMSRYCLSISYPMVMGTSNRTYNILSAGGFLLIKHFPGIERLFRSMEHCAWFKTADEALRLMNYFDRNNDHYHAIRRNGHELYLQKHTARCRLQNMFDIMNQTTNKFYGYLQ